VRARVQIPSLLVSMCSTECTQTLQSLSVRVSIQGHCVPSIILNRPSILLLHGPSSAVCIDTAAFIRRDGGQAASSEENTQIRVLRNAKLSSESARGTGYMNDGEASLTANTFQRLLQLNECLQPGDIAVITPYVEQKRAILAKIRDSAYGPAERVMVDTVDSFQGKEASVVVIDLVRSDRGRIGFIRDEKRANVTISRAND
jgi:AAA domain